MPRTIATNTAVDRAELEEFVRDRHHFIVITRRSDGAPQASPVAGGLDGEGRLVIATYPERAKTKNAARDPRVSVLVLSDDFDGPWVQIDGDCEVINAVDGEDALDAFVEYYRGAGGEHPNWAEYRQAMVDQNKSLLRITPTRWGPIATGGFPARLAS